MANRYVLGIDIGGTNLRLGCVTENGEIEHFERMPSPPIITGDAVGNLAKTVLDYLDRHSMKDSIAAISVGVPSAVSKDKSYIYSSPNLLDLQNVDLGSEMLKLTGIKTFIDRDVNFLLKNDIFCQNLDPDHNATILGFYIGTGLGNAVYINGQFHAGRNGVAGELGHIPFYKVDTPCGCGNNGCCETLCSGYHLADLVKEHFPDTRIDDIFTEHSDHPLIQEYIDTMSLPIASEITLLDPDFVIMGGGVASMKDFPMKALEEAIAKHTRHPYPANNLVFKYSEVSQACGVRGGALTAFERLEK